jgi:serine/threonine protein kinase
VTPHDPRSPVVPISPEDHRLAGLQGTVLTTGDAIYRLERSIGAGSMAAAFLATRRGANGEIPVVVKVTLPSFLRHAGAAAGIALRKEAVALGRLATVVPATPFVVRYIDVGELWIDSGHGRSELPWIAIEWVHGGAEGTTLVSRVEHAIETTGHAFDPRRAERAIQCLTSGFSAIHALQIVHRDLKPENVLCCGSGPDELLKIADFGIARSVGMKETFGQATLGTVGYAPPEQNGRDPTKVGPWSDVYALAAVIYYLLTGREYFKIHDPLAPFRGDLRPQTRTPLAESPTLHPELRERTEACAALDRVIAEATSPAIEQRPQSAEVLNWRILGALRLDSRARRPGVPVRALPRKAPERQGWRWSVAGRPIADLVVRSVAWNGDGRALAATDRGLAFWDGTQWAEVSTRGYAHPQGIRFVQRLGAGRWLLGGDSAMLARFDGSKIVEVVEGPDKHLTARHASGDIDDLAVFCFAQPNAPPSLYSICGGRWLEPLPLDGVDVVNSLARLEDEAWLVAGRATDGQAYLAIHRPLRFRVDRLAIGHVRTLLAAAATPHRELGLACGLDGRIAWIAHGAVNAVSALPETPPLSSAALDPSGRAWFASAGAIWSGVSPASEQLAWADRSFEAPFAALHADDGVLFAMTVNGAVVEGRQERG